MNADELPLNIVIVGHVDHGKSTLIGRLLYETDSLPEGKVNELIESSRRRGVEVEWSFVLDALQAERDQAITIDTTRIWFRANGRRYAIIDAPGHRQFVANMLSGASEADAAILIVDVTEGVSEQTRRHAYLLHLLGITQVMVAVNKMDLAGYEQQRFDAVAGETAAHLADLGIVPLAVVPVAARHGENLVRRAESMPWYGGPAILELLATFVSRASLRYGPFRMRVQDVYRAGTARTAVGRIESGSVAAGDRIIVSPTGSHATVKNIERWPEFGPQRAEAGESIGISVEEPVYIERGDVLSATDGVPLNSTSFGATFFWLDEEAPHTGDVLRLQFGPTETRVTVEAIERVVDTETLAVLPGSDVPQYAVVDLRLRSSALLPLDTRQTSPATSRCVLLRGADVIAGGFIAHVAPARVRATNIHPEHHLVLREERTQRNGHSGAVIWLTGLSAAGKSTIAMATERRLFARGRFVYVLDGDNVRSGLNQDLRFTAEDRVENIRRVAQVAALFADAGAVVITAFISPFAQDRALARAAVGASFHEIYIAADLATCEARDPKGLYRRARNGEITDFTGISSPYEPPAHPELIIDSSAPLGVCVEGLVAYVLQATDLHELQPAGAGTGLDDARL